MVGGGPAELSVTVTGPAASTLNVWIARPPTGIVPLNVSGAAGVVVVDVMVGAVRWSLLVHADPVMAVSATSTPKRYFIQASRLSGPDPSQSWNCRSDATRRP